MDYYTLGLQESMLSGNNIGYPPANEVSILGQVWAPRIYGKDVTAFEIASSGKIAVSLLDTHVLDISKIDDKVMLATKSNYTLEFTNNKSIIQIDGTTDAVKVTSSNNIELRAASNVYVKGKKFIIDTEEAFAYTFNVNQAGDLEIVKTVKTETGTTIKVVATFGRDRSVML